MHHRFSNTTKALLLSACAFSLQFAPLSAEEEVKISPHEALLLKRIVEYWKDEDYSLAQNQILDFLSAYPESSVKDHLTAMLGDLYFKEGDFSQAVSNYSQIQSDEFKEKVFLKHLKALNEIKDHKALVELAASKFKQSSAQPDLQLRLLYASALHNLGKTDEAFPHFKILADSEFREFSLLPLAEGYRAQENWKEALSYYHLFLESHQDQKEDVLFQIASIETHVDKHRAAETFCTVANLKGEKAAPARFNQLALLFELEQYTNLLEVAEEGLDLLDGEQLHLAHFYIGCSHFHRQEFSSAVAPLETFVQKEEASSPKLKTALLDLMVCSREVDDSSLSDRTVKRLAASFSQDPNTLQSFLMHAQLQREEGGVSLTAEEIKRLLDISPEFEGKEAIVYDIALLLMQENKWQEGREVLSLFLTQYPTSEKRVFALRHLLNNSVELMRANPENASCQKLFLEDFALATQDQGVLSADELQNYRFQEAQILYDLGQFDVAAARLERFLQDYPNDEKTGKTHLLAALCYEKTSENKDKSAWYFEKALALSSEHSDAATIHLKLYNYYIALSSTDAENREAHYDKAADHLFHTFLTQKEAIKLDNQLWLANHFYNKAKAAVQESQNPLDDKFLPLKRAIVTYETLLGIEDGVIAFPKGDKSLVLEGEALKFADLLTIKRDLPKKIALLKALTETARASSDLEWKHQQNALFELAKAYETQEDVSKALEIYNELLDHHAPTHLTNVAMLNKARLEFSILPQEKREDSSPEVVSILNNLKDLQIKKRVESEPLHLEAGLDYVDVRVSIAPDEAKIDKHLFFLNRYKDDFSSTEDLTAQEYANSRAQNPTKEQLYTHYMRFVDAEIARLKAVKAKGEGNVEEASHFFAQARAEYDALMQERQSLTSYLVQKIEHSKGLVE